MVMIMMNEGIVPNIVAKPVFSRINNIGKHGVNVAASFYEKLGFDKVISPTEKRFDWLANWKHEQQYPMATSLREFWSECKFNG